MMTFDEVRIAIEKIALIEVKNADGVWSPALASWLSGDQVFIRHVGPEVPCRFEDMRKKLPE